VRDELSLPIAIMLDTKGPEYRIKTFKNGKVTVKDGDTFSFTTEDIDLIAKIENKSGIDNIEEICEECDGIMIARGNLGVEVPFTELPSIQKYLITKCRMLGKRVITATEMLETMIYNPRPTRAEISDVANAVYDGTSVVMLSGESAEEKSGNTNIIKVETV